MTIKIEVEHWHDSDGFSRDDGWTAAWKDTENLNNKGIQNGDSYEEVIEKVIKSLGWGEVKITRCSDTYTAY